MNKRTAVSLSQLPATARMLISLAVGAITFLLTQKGTDPVKYISVWLAFAGSHLLLSWTIIQWARTDDIQKIAKKEDNSRWIVFLLVVIASFASLIAVIVLLRTLPEVNGRVYYIQVALTVLTVVCSWVLIHTVFTFHYAHLFYSDIEPQHSKGTGNYEGLEFPNQPEPDYKDFAYFSFVVGMTFQVSDVQVTSKRFRRLVLIHSLLSFAYNTVILALSITIISGIIQK